MSAYRLEASSHNISYNLQIMRFVAACMVIISHAYPITMGNMAKEPLYGLTGGQLSLGGLAVAVFFLCGGFLIAGSIEKKRTAKAYFAARCKRIFPQLWCMVALSIFAGVFLTSLPKMEYLSDSHTWLYLLNGLFIPIHNLPGVFEQAPYLPTINGALWTLSVEFGCYILCFVCYRLKVLKKGYFLLCLLPAILLMVVLYMLEDTIPGFMQIYRPCMLFMIGMGFWVYRDRIKLYPAMLLPMAVLLVLSWKYGFANFGMILFFPYLSFLLWYALPQVPKRMGTVGDISYEIYLMAFPIQQTLVYLNNNSMSVLENALGAISCSIILGIILHRFSAILCRIWNKV